MEQEGIVSKSPDPNHKQKHIYRLTPAGIDLLPVLAAIGKWGVQHRPVDLVKYPHAAELVAGGATGRRWCTTTWAQLTKRGS